MFNFSLIQVNFINLSKFLFRYIPQKVKLPLFDSLLLYKILVLLLVLLLMICVSSPEQLKGPSTVSLFFILAILFSLWTKSCLHGFPNFFDMEPAANFHWAILVGNIFYSVEGLSSVFTIRSSMQTPTQMGTVYLTEGC